MRNFFLIITFISSIYRSYSQSNDPVQVFGLTIEGTENIKQFTSIKEAIKNPNEVYWLELSDPKLTRIPKEVYSFKNLTYLFFYSNRITEINDSIGLLKNLELLLSKSSFFSYPYKTATVSKLLIIPACISCELSPIIKPLNMICSLQISSTI